MQSINSKRILLRRSDIAVNGDEMRKLKKEFRKVQRRNIFLYEQNSFMKFDQLRTSDSKKFWSTIRGRKKAGESILTEKCFLKDLAGRFVDCG